jgi:hypothetical protein
MVSPPSVPDAVPSEPVAPESSPQPAAAPSAPSPLPASVPEAISPKLSPAAASAPQLPVVHSLEDEFVHLADVSPAEAVPYFKHNVETITHFPEDGSAQIKSFRGQLDRADGLLRVVNSQWGTQLPETIPVIVTTFTTAYLVFQKALRNVETKNSSEEKIRHLRPLWDALSQEIALLKGLNNIKIVYETRYENTPKDGLDELNRLYEHAQRVTEEHQQQYKSLIQPLAPPSANELLSSVFGGVPNELTEKEAAVRLSAYCRLYCPGIDSHQAVELIQKGQLLMKGILSGAREPSRDHEASQLELAQLTWFLTWCALKKKQGAHEASFAIEIEPDSRIYHFLTSAPYSYQRPSSHYMGRSERSRDYSSYLMASSQHHAVDVHNSPMPAKKRTILFELVDTMSGPKNLLFFRPENFGTRTYGDYAMHSLEFVESVQRKSGANGGDDASGMQKERIPDAAKKGFAALLQHLQQNRAIYDPILSKLPGIYDLTKALDFAKLYGIAFMFEFIRGIETQADCPREFKNFSDPVKKTWESLDHLDKRTGREIYLTPDELASFVSMDII